jgi:hypothetical protein
MTRSALCSLVALFLLPFAVAKDKSAFPKMIVTAKYVFVTSYFGDNLADSRVPTADRQAVIDVQDAIRDWGRYSVVSDRKDAELIILVRKGRVAETRNGIDVHAGSQRPGASVGPATATDAGDSQDMLAVYNASLGTDTAPIWRDRIAGGLAPPKMELLNELRTKVEAAANNP